MPAHRSIIAVRLAADGARALSASPNGASRWTLPVSLALHVVVVLLVASLHIPSPTPPTVVSVELSYLDAAVEPPSASEAVVETGREVPPDLPAEEPVEQTVESVLQPVADSPGPVTEVPVEDPTPLSAEVPSADLPVPAEPPKPEPARPVPVPRPLPKPARNKNPPVASPRSSTPDPAVDRIVQAAPAQPVQSAAPPSSPSRGSDREAADYLGVVQARLARHKIYPRSARLTRQEGTVLVRFTIVSDGTITGWSIVQGAGHDILDQAAEDMIRRASPLPPIPAGMGRTHIDITLPVQYSLQ